LSGVRPFDLDRDLEAVRRIWHEAGWLMEDQSEGRALKAFLTSADVWVEDTAGDVECAVSTVPGEMRYLEEDIPFCAVTSVTTGYVGRRQGLARSVLTYALERAAAAGAVAAALGAFEQGFYDALGFGTGSYERQVRFDPSDLLSKRLGLVSGRPRRPVRFSAEDAEALHQARLRRMRRHGGCNILRSGITEHEMLYLKNSFGLGYRDGPGGSPSHYMWCVFQGETGPLVVYWMVFRTIEELRELLGLLATLGDQYHSVEVWEPMWLQLQVGLNRPFRRFGQTAGSSRAQGVTAEAYWQARILNVEKAVERMRLPEGGEIEFVLRLTDPLEKYLDDDPRWSGCGGDYTIRLGPRSRAVPEGQAGLPELRCSVNAFTRLWLGVATAESLTVTNGLSGDPELIASLSNRLRLPAPGLDWQF
jgi:GNAT superfamily N-acetyltransferase